MPSGEVGTAGRERRGAWGRASLSLSPGWGRGWGGVWSSLEGLAKASG